MVLAWRLHAGRRVVWGLDQKRERISHVMAGLVAAFERMGACSYRGRCCSL